MKFYSPAPHIKPLCLPHHQRPFGTVDGLFAYFSFLPKGSQMGCLRSSPNFQILGLKTAIMCLLYPKAGDDFTFPDSLESPWSWACILFKWKSTAMTKKENVGQGHVGVKALGKRQRSAYFSQNRSLLTCSPRARSLALLPPTEAQCGSGTERETLLAWNTRDGCHCCPSFPSHRGMCPTSSF